jgi:hypothetical protein
MSTLLREICWHSSIIQFKFKILSIQSQNEFEMMAGNLSDSVVPSIMMYDMFWGLIPN